MIMKTYSSKVIANEFIRLAEKDGGITHMQIQKLIYFAHAIRLVVYDKPLIKRKFYAFPYGPVDIDVYEALRLSGDKKFKIENSIKKINKKETIDGETLELLEVVYNTFWDEIGWEFSEFSFEDAPWRKSYRIGQSNIIQNKDIKNFYREYWK